MPVAVQQSDVPFKLNIEAGAGLFPGRGSMTVKHLQINFGTLRQRAKPRRLVLNRMCRYDSNLVRQKLVVSRLLPENAPDLIKEQLLRRRGIESTYIIVVPVF